MHWPARTLGTLSLCLVLTIAQPRAARRHRPPRPRRRRRRPPHLHPHRRRRPRRRRRSPHLRAAHRGAAVRAKSLDQLNAERPLADVYFDLDESSIRDDARPLLQRNAEWMKRWPSTRVNVEGHCDERGTAEYNLGLGDRRSNSVKDYLVSLGIPADRINVVSKGKESPVCTDRTEACWQQNRRGHFVITAK